MPALRRPFPRVRWTALCLLCELLLTSPLNQITHLHRTPKLAGRRRVDAARRGT